MREILQLLVGLAIFLVHSSVRADEPPTTAAEPVPDRPVQIPELPPDPRESEPIAYFLRSRDTAARVPDLEIFDTEAPIVLVAVGSDIKPTIAVRGRFQREGWSLFAQEGARPLTKEFTVYAHLRGRLNEITFLAKGPNGEKQTERIYIYAPNAKSFHVVSAWENLLFSTGLANFSYLQTGYGIYESVNVAASVRYGPLDTDAFMTVLASAEMTVLALASSPIDTAPQLFEARGNLSFRTNKQPLLRTRHRILLGVGYLTMFSNGSPFGFSNLAVPDLGFQSRYIASAKTDWIGEVHFMPIGGLEALGQNGVNVSLAWSRLLENSRRMEVAMVYSGYNYKPEERISIGTSLFTVRVGLTL